MLNPPIPQPDPATGLAPLQDIETTAKLLSVSTSTIIRLANTGELQEVRVGGRRLFSVKAIEDFIARATRTAQERNKERQQRAVERRAKTKEMTPQK